MSPHNQRRTPFRFDEMNGDEQSRRTEGKHVLVHVAMVTSSPTWARPEEKSRCRRREKKRSGEERPRRRQGETNVKGREVKTSLPIVAARVSRRGLPGVRENVAKRRRRGELSANMRFLATVRWRPPLSGKNHAIPPTLFPDLSPNRLRLPVAGRECRDARLWCCHRSRFRCFTLRESDIHRIPARQIISL